MSHTAACGAAGPHSSPTWPSAPQKLPEEKHAPTEDELAWLARQAGRRAFLWHTTVPPYWAGSVRLRRETNPPLFGATTSQIKAVMQGRPDCVGPGWRCGPSQACAGMRGDVEELGGGHCLKKMPASGKSCLLDCLLCRLLSALPAWTQHFGLDSVDGVL